MPILETDKDVANLLQVEYSTLRYLTYHRDVVTFDNYYRFDIPKKSGGMRHIAAPKTQLKMVLLSKNLLLQGQKYILQALLY